MVTKKYNEILKNLENKIENKKDLNIAKSAIADLAIWYSGELAKLSDCYSSKVIEFETRLKNLENKLSDEEDDDIDVEFEEVHLSENIACPYCNFEFLVEYDEDNHEITCPKCDNLIELDWGEFEDDM